MAAAKQVYWAVGRSGRSNGKQNLEQLSVALILHQRDDATHRVDSKAPELPLGFAHQVAGLSPQIFIQAPLDWPI